jgi:RNA polymerase sigma-70 factor (ECF subfamily)
VKSTPIHSNPELDSDAAMVPTVPESRSIGSQLAESSLKALSTLQSGPSDPQPSEKPGVQKDMEAVAALERDAELMLRVRAGDDTSFALLLERHRGPVVHFLFRMVQNQPVSEELAQEVFLRVYRSRATYEPTAKFTTWLFRIATHLALNWIRDGKKEKRQESLDVDVSEGMERQVPDRQRTIEQEMLYEVKLREVRQAIQALPEKQRAAVLMHKYQELEYTQIARSLGCSESAVKSLLFRAYETLRARLAHMA